MSCTAKTPIPGPCVGHCSGNGRLKCSADSPAHDQKTIGRFGLGPRAASVRQECLRSSIKIARQGAESPPQPGLPQGHPAKLFLGPIGRGRGRRPRRGRRARGQPWLLGQPLEHGPETLLQRADQINLLSLARLVRAVLATAPLGQRNGLPVGGTITDPVETRPLNKGLGQDGPIAVALLPIVG